MGTERERKRIVKVISSWYARHVPFSSATIAAALWLLIGWLPLVVIVVVVVVVAAAAYLCVHAGVHTCIACRCI